MKLITITQPAFFEGEAEAITSLFDAGLEILHLRKPGASYEDMEQLLNRLPPEYLKRIVTHEHFQLASFRNLKGIHLNGRNPAAPAGFPPRRSPPDPPAVPAIRWKKSSNTKQHAITYFSVPYTTAFPKKDIPLPILPTVCKRRGRRAL